MGGLPGNATVTSRKGPRMPLFRVQIGSLKPEIFRVDTYEGDDPEQVLQNVMKKHRVLAAAVTIDPVHREDAALIAELEKMVGHPIFSPMIDWKDGRVVGLDWGGPLCTYGMGPDDELEPISRLVHLKELSLRGNVKMTDRGLRHLRPLVKLETLILDEMQIGDDCTPHLQHLVRVRQLYLGKATFPHEGIKREGVFTDRGVRRLKTLRRLYAFSLSYNEVKGRSLEAFESLGKLEHFDVDDNPFDDRGVAALTRARKLRRLSLSNTRVTDGGLAHLERLKSMNEINLPETTVTPAAVDRLRRKLPKCTIYPASGRDE